MRGKYWKCECETNNIHTIAEEWCVPCNVFKAEGTSPTVPEIRHWLKEKMEWICPDCGNKEPVTGSDLDSISFYVNKGKPCPMCNFPMSAMMKC